MPGRTTPCGFGVEAGEASTQDSPVDVMDADWPPSSLSSSRTFEVTGRVRVLGFGVVKPSLLLPEAGSRTVDRPGVKGAIPRACDVTGCRLGETCRCSRPAAVSISRVSSSIERLTSARRSLRLNAVSSSSR